MVLVWPRVRVRVPVRPNWGSIQRVQPGLRITMRTGPRTGTGYS